MILVMNFSHPLTEEAVNAIRFNYGNGDARIVQVPVQIDRSQSVVQQTYHIAQGSLRLAGVNTFGQVDCIILPGLSDVAAILGSLFAGSNIIVMAPVLNSVPPKFMPTELIRPFDRGLGRPAVLED